MASARQLVIGCLSAGALALSCGFCHSPAGWPGLGFMEGQESKREWLCTVPQRPRIRVGMFSHVPHYLGQSKSQRVGRFHSFVKRAINSHWKGRVGKWSHFCNSPSLVTEAKHFSICLVCGVFVGDVFCFLLFDCSMWDFGSPTRDWIWARCIGNAES